MYYSELSKLYKIKFSTYTLAMCDYAIADIDVTLKLHTDKSMDDHYVEKLFCERDAALDRKMVLNRKNVE